MSCRTITFTISFPPERAPSGWLPAAAGLFGGTPKRGSCAASPGPTGCPIISSTPFTRTSSATFGSPPTTASASLTLPRRRYASIQRPTASATPSLTVHLIAGMRKVTFTSVPWTVSLLSIRVISSPTPPPGGLLSYSPPLGGMMRRGETSLINSIRCWVVKPSL